MSALVSVYFLPACSIDLVSFTIQFSNNYTTMTKQGNTTSKQLRDWKKSVKISEEQGCVYQWLWRGMLPSSYNY